MCLFIKTMLILKNYVFFHVLVLRNESDQNGDFTSSVLKKEFDELVNKIIPSLEDCSKCGKFCYKNCKKFSITCSLCRKERCKNCCSYKTSLEIILSNGNEQTRHYVSSFINDFFGVSEVTAGVFNLNVAGVCVEKRKRNLSNEKLCKK